MVAIRAADPADAPVLSALALRSKAHWGYDPGFLAACAAGLTLAPAHLDGGRAFVAERGEGPLGFAALDPDGPDGFELTHLFVDPPAIGNGVGRRLWHRAADTALRSGATSLVVEADPNAVGFYHRLGAVQVGTRPSTAAPDRWLPLLRLVFD